MGRIIGFRLVYSFIDTMKCFEKGTQSTLIPERQKPASEIAPLIMHRLLPYRIFSDLENRFLDVLRV